MAERVGDTIYDAVTKRWLEVMTFDHQSYAVLDDLDADTVYILIERRDCDSCSGRGWYLDLGDGDGDDDDADEFERFECEDCDGDGHEYVLDEDNILTRDEMRAIRRQWAWLEKRYGTTQVRHIADFWQPA